MLSEEVILRKYKGLCEELETIYSKDNKEETLVECMYRHSIQDYINILKYVLEIK